LGSIEKIAINLGETIKKNKFTPPCPIKATLTPIASNQDDDASDVVMMSSSQIKGIHVNYSTPTTKDPLEGKPQQ
jgi:hypothetical protein